MGKTVLGEHAPTRKGPREAELAAEGRQGYRMMKDAANHENRLAVRCRQGWIVEEDLGDSVLISLPFDEAEKRAAEAREKDLVQRRALARRADVAGSRVQRIAEDDFEAAPLTLDEGVDG